MNQVLDDHVPLRRMQVRAHDVPTVYESQLEKSNQDEEKIRKSVHCESD